MSYPVSKPSTSGHSMKLEFNRKCKTNHFNKLTSGLEDLRRQQDGTDIEIKCKDGSVYAHKYVLISSCDYFEAMFITKMREETSGLANFTTTSRNVMEIIIEYLYTSQTKHEFTEDDTELLMDMLSTCHLMQLTDLFQAVWNTTTKLLNIENFCAIWKIGITLDLITWESDKIIDFAIANTSNIKWVPSFDEKDMKSCITFMITEGEVWSAVVAIIAWNFDHTRDEEAARLMENCDLTSLSNEDFSDICLRACQRQRKQKSDESILFEEAGRRLH